MWMGLPLSVLVPWSLAQLLQWDFVALSPACSDTKTLRPLSGWTTWYYIRYVIRRQIFRPRRFCGGPFVTQLFGHTRAARFVTTRLTWQITHMGTKLLSLFCCQHTQQNTSNPWLVRLNPPYSDPNKVAIPRWSSVVLTNISWVRLDGR
jgi:hypothetical protein